jgi:hypothetical protein
MRPIDCARIGVLACALAGAGAMAQQHDDSAVAPAVAQKQQQEIRQGDPARWYKQDGTADAALRTKQKEIKAAYDEAKRACIGEPKAERAGCLKDARTTFDQDMANARGLVDSAPHGQVTSTVTQTTPGQ